MKRSSKERRTDLKLTNRRKFVRDVEEKGNQKPMS